MNSIISLWPIQHLRIYHPRNPTDSPLWNLLNNHYDDFEKHYEEKYEKKYGYFRPVISEVVTEYLKCGDLKEGFARVRCQDCGHEFILSKLSRKAPNDRIGR